MVVHSLIYLWVFIGTNNPVSWGSNIVCKWGLTMREGNPVDIIRDRMISYRKDGHNLKLSTLFGSGVMIGYFEPSSVKNRSTLSRYESFLHNRYKRNNIEGRLYPFLRKEGDDGRIHARECFDLDLPTLMSDIKSLEQGYAVDPDTGNILNYGKFHAIDSGFGIFWKDDNTYERKMCIDSYKVPCTKHLSGSSDNFRIVVPMDTTKY